MPISLAEALSERRYLAHLARNYKNFKEKHAGNIITERRTEAEGSDIKDFSLNITNLDNIDFIGCQGVNGFSGSLWNGSRVKINGVNAQIAVASMTKTGSKLSGRPHDHADSQLTQRISSTEHTVVKFLLGDNFYSDGLGYKTFATFNPDTSRTFSSNFTNINYGTSYAALGNHDYGIWSHGGTQDAQFKLGLALNQVRLDYNEHPNSKDWNMPYRYYFISTAFADIYVIDSSTFPYDQRQQNWLRFVKGRQISLNCNPRVGSPGRENNQKHQILISHHPLLSIGKRSPHHEKAHKDKFKYSRYFEPTQKKDDASGSLNEALYHLLDEYRFDVIVSAHDHHLAAYDIINRDGSKTLQIVSGGGGAELEKIKKTNYEGLIVNDTRSGSASHGGSRDSYAFISANQTYSGEGITKENERNLFIEDCHGYANMTLSENSIDFTFFWLKQKGGEGCKTGIRRVSSNIRNFGRAHSI
jgi:hypothetical protein